MYKYSSLSVISTLLFVLLSKSHVTPHWPSNLDTLKQVREVETKEENNIYLKVTI